MDFPEYQWWADNIVHAGDEQFRKRHYYDYYFQKYMIANLFEPLVICEIGVRWGYSAYSFLCASPRADYTGYDIVNGGHGGAKTDTFAHVNLMLGQNFPDAGKNMVHADTQMLDRLAGPYDFAHVDGDHTEAGCLHDINLAFEACVSGGIILVDDYSYIAGVKRAVNKFVKTNQKDIRNYHSIASLRGEYLIIKK